MEKNLLAVKSFLAFILFISMSSALMSETRTSTTELPERFNSTPNRENVDLEFVRLSQEMKDRRTFESSGFYNKLDTSLLYSPSKDEDLRLFLATVYEANNEDENQQYFELAEFMYRIKGILTKQDNGVEMDLELKTYYVTENDLRDRWGYSGAFIPQLVLSKNITSWLSMKAKVRQHINMRKNAQPYTVKEQTRIYLSPTFLFTRKFMFNTEFTWKHKNRVASSRYSPKKTDLIEVRPSLMYLVNRSFLAEVFTESKLAKSHDGTSINENLTDEMVYGVGMYWTAF